MISNPSLRRSALGLAIAASFSMAGSGEARELGNLNVNRPTAEAKRSVDPQAALAARRQGRDGIGRETFSWIQRPLDDAAKAIAATPEAAARAHLAQLLGEAKQSAAAVDVLDLHKVDAQRGGSQLVQYRPRIDGIPIFHEDLALLLDRQHSLVAMRGPLPRSGADAGKSLPAFALDARAAIVHALASYDFEAKAGAALQGRGERGEYAIFALASDARSKSGALGAGEQRAKRVYFRTADGLLPAWYVETQISDSFAAPADYYAHVISAVDGRVLFRMNQVADAQAFSYRVWAEGGADRLPLPSPEGRGGMPDPDGLPSNNVIPLVAQELRTLPNAPFSQAATDGWLAPNATVTSGNNVNAFADRAEPSGFGAGDLQPTVTAPFTFDYSFNTALAPAADATQTQSSTLQMFYWVNWLHDWFYDSGFKEVDGNAQIDNFGRGGLGADAIRAEAQDYAIVDNANMATPADGATPRMQMGLTSGPPARDNTVDGHTLAHEWGHFITNRLVGDASGLNTEHAGGMGEGWGDFIALLATVKEEDKFKPGNENFSGAYGFSGYSDNSTYYGIRRYPYSTNLAKSPLTFRHVADNLSLSEFLAAPNFGRNGANNSEVHNQGEIWALSLWDAYTALLNDTARLSFSQAQSRMKAYLVSGLKLTPVSPTMTEARDAILASILAAGETRDFELVAAAFAKRGLGAGALVPDRYSETMHEVVESKLSGSDMAVLSSSLGIPTGCDSDAVLDLGERAQLTVTVANTGFAPLPAGTLNLSSTNPALTFPNGAEVALAAIPMFGTASVSVPVQLSAAVAPNTPMTLTLTPNAPGINAPPGATQSRVLFLNFDESPRSSTTEGFDGAQTNWVNSRAPAGTGSGQWRNQTQGSRKFLHGDDTNSRAITWIETPSMAVGAGPLSLTLNHRYLFEADSSDLYDGGVIQASIDGGQTWTPIDAAAAGYALTRLSSCCENPLAGQGAFTDKSAAYPEYLDQTIDLGTTYANQANFKLRFGVATDAAVTRGGWDINSLTVNGLTNTPFSSVVAQSASCSTAANKALQGSLSGTYYNPERSGEGVLVDFGEIGGTPVLFFTWYTYLGGEQQWLVGSTPFALTDTSKAVDLISTRGANFGSAFRSQDVVTSNWGSVAVTFPTCDRMTLSYQQAGGESGTLTLDRGLERLASGQCSTLHGGLSGTYYDTARSGEGVLVDFGKVGNQSTEFFTWYTYEGGEQRWLVGNQNFSATDGSVSVDLISTRGTGFGSQFRADQVTTAPWGRVTQRFINCDTLELSYQKTGGESGTQLLTRGLNRLGDGQCR